jgi:hypothetical protein
MSCPTKAESIGSERKGSALIAALSGSWRSGGVLFLGRSFVLFTYFTDLPDLFSCCMFLLFCWLVVSFCGRRW